MYQVSCKDIGMIECTFVGKGATIEEVKQKAMAHAQVAHKDKLAAMSKAQLTDLDRVLTSKIKQLA